MTVQAMGYFWVGTSKLEDWTSLAGTRRLIAAALYVPSVWTTGSNG
jgi:hypothetical protein